MCVCVIFLHFFSTFRNLSCFCFWKLGIFPGFFGNSWLTQAYYIPIILKSRNLRIIIHRLLFFFLNQNIKSRKQKMERRTQMRVWVHEFCLFPLLGKRSSLYINHTQFVCVSTLYIGCSQYFPFNPYTPKLTLYRGKTRHMREHLELLYHKEEIFHKFNKSVFVLCHNTHIRIRVNPWINLTISPFTISVGNIT